MDHRISLIFLIITKKFIFPLEAKFSTKDDINQLPKWNSNIPKSNAIYLFASISKFNPIIFLGGDYLDDNVRVRLVDYFDEFNQEEKINKLKNEIERKYNHFGLFPKIRTDYLSRNDFKFGNEKN